MKKTHIIITSLGFLLVIGLLSYGVYWAFFDMNRLPKGDLISEVNSPSRDYTIKAYNSSGGATTDFAVLGELNFNNENRKPKNIYWNYHEEEANIKWLDEDTVIINRHKLNVPHETFDYRNDK
ncbi:hypothetical protein AWH48_11690 [Domibacillus aminovorans]|uniref:DUF5412 domain-containing protein n=1 Tax=Domibacillus aminovorans TaxID=29332 RepID=A0A177KKN5_9BACI|nr:DUF5412 domain-containing protein [Domibacillus aminovorans]OAH53923.1 hypothetical protein AWH48_11690 [Domibacillus aminovorans]